MRNLEREFSKLQALLQAYAIISTQVIEGGSSAPSRRPEADAHHAPAQPLIPPPQCRLPSGHARLPHT